MHIGLVVYGDLSTVSGGFLYDRKLVEYLRESGGEVEVISLPWHGYPRLLAHNFSRSLRKKIAGMELDLLLQDELNHPSLFRLNGALEDLPIVSIVHHLRSKEAHSRWAMPVYRWAENRYLSSVDAFIFNSRTTRADVANAIGRLKSQCHCLPGGRPAESGHHTSECHRTSQRCRSSSSPVPWKPDTAQGASHPGIGSRYIGPRVEPRRGGAGR